MATDYWAESSSFNQIIRHPRFYVQLSKKIFKGFYFKVQKSIKFQMTLFWHKFPFFSPLYGSQPSTALQLLWISPPLQWWRSLSLLWAFSWSHSCSLFWSTSSSRCTISTWGRNLSISIAYWTFSMASWLSSYSLVLSSTLSSLSAVSSSWTMMSSPSESSSWGVSRS